MFLCSGYLKNTTFTLHHPRQGCHCPTSLCSHYCILLYLQLYSLLLPSQSLPPVLLPTCRRALIPVPLFPLPCSTHHSQWWWPLFTASILVMLDLLPLTHRGAAVFQEGITTLLMVTASLVFTGDTPVGTLINDGIEQLFGTRQPSSCFDGWVKQITSLNATMSLHITANTTAPWGRAGEPLGPGPVLHDPWQSSALSHSRDEVA